MSAESIKEGKILNKKGVGEGRWESKGLAQERRVRE